MTRAGTWNAGNLAAGASVAGLAAYGWVRAAHEGFYGSFGVTVEEAGIQPHAMVARALVLAGAWAVIALFVAGIAGVVLGVLWAFDRWFDRTLDLDHLSARELAVGASAGLVLAAGGLVLVLRHDSPLAVLGGIAIAAGISAAARVGALLRRVFGIRHGRILLAVVAVVAYLGGLFSCLSSGSDWGRRAKTEGPRSIGASVLIGRWPAPGLLESPPARSTGELLLLGASEGIAVLYDPRLDELLRIPVERATFFNGRTGSSGSPNS